MRRILLFIFAVSLILSIAAPCALADGCYYPESMYSSLPAITAQRALVIHRLGIERLIIESSFVGEGKNFGWIVPVPEKPLDIQAVNPGFLKTLSLCAQPKIVNDRTKEKDFWLCIAAITSIWLLFIVIAQPSPTVASVTLGVLVTCLCLIVPSFISLRGQHAAPATVASGGAKVEHESVVGSYQVSVINAESAETLNQWLKKQRIQGALGRGSFRCGRLHKEAVAFYHCQTDKRR